MRNSERNPGELLGEIAGEIPEGWIGRSNHKKISMEEVLRGITKRHPMKTAGRNTIRENVRFKLLFRRTSAKNSDRNSFRNYG